MTRRTLLLTFPLAIVLVVNVAAPAAFAVKQPEEHCVLRLVPISTDAATSTTQAAVEEEGCYPTLDQALAVGTGTGSLTEGSLALGGGVTAAAEEIPGSGDVLIGIEYNEPAYEGSSFSYYAPTGCLNTTWEVSYVGSNWNNIFESGKAFGACDRNRKYAGSNFIGDSLLCTPNCANYGTLRNDVSSLRWRSG